MHRPTRIVVLGILCLAMAGLSSCKNLSEASISLMGPDMLEKVLEQEGVAGFQKDSMQTMIRALREPAFRIVNGVESFVSTVMSVVLLAGGIGLLMDRRWGIRLAQVWGFYALVLGVINVVLQVRYVVPASPSLPPGSDGLAMVSGIGCYLPIFWLFPVLLLTMLNRPIVLDYMRWRASQRGGGSAVPMSMPTHEPPRTMPRPGQTPPTTPPRAQGTADPQQTWRDDPWNDPNSQ